MTVDGNGKIKITSIGFLEVEISSGAIEIRTVVYDAVNGNKTENLTRSHDEISHYKNNAFVGYKLDNGTSGICHYLFEKNDGIDTIVGTFIDKEFATRRTVLGIRDNFSSIENMNQLSASQVQRKIANTETMLRQIGLFKKVNGPDYEI
ncbi:hypothetical protein J7481_11425 [Labrenzia sp. R4_2]|uniref:hypothetical protein n=1 Tax=Labrenzia sp. R4_2 TaxID=2821107 RepID=UPI001ADABB5E|nr:hypothetical protein [Labrenzia sp. R4_2]MBO9420108.1 hypothetical protein [Labrenzia sp. R4_2]